MVRVRLGNGGPPECQTQIGTAVVAELITYYTELTGIHYASVKNHSV